MLCPCPRPPPSDPRVQSVRPLAEGPHSEAPPLCWAREGRSCNREIDAVLPAPGPECVSFPGRDAAAGRTPRAAGGCRTPPLATGPLGLKLRGHSGPASRPSLPAQPPHLCSGHWSWRSSPARGRRPAVCKGPLALLTRSARGGAKPAGARPGAAGSGPRPPLPGPPALPGRPAAVPLSCRLRPRGGRAREVPRPPPPPSRSAPHCPTSPTDLPIVPDA